jgi:ATP-dependent Clp protease, protease subunit
MYDESIKGGEIWVTKFDEESAQKFRALVMEASKLDPSKPIVIYIDSYGGYVDSLAKMIETIDEIPNPVITACLGKAMSCGAILLSHGDVRFLGPHSRVMVHEISSGTFGDVHDMHADVKETVRMNNYFMGLLAKNCGFKSYAELRSIIKDQDGRDRYLFGDDAVKFGIVDVIGTPRISGKILYEVSKQPKKASIGPKNEQTLIPRKKEQSKTNKKDIKKTKPKKAKQ